MSCRAIGSIPIPAPINFLKGDVLTGTSTAIGSSAFAEVITALQAQISVATVVEVLAYAAGAVVALVFMWWGVRKVAQMVMSAFRSGRISI